MSKAKQEKSKNLTSFHGPVYGPVHTGEGDIQIEQLNYKNNTDERFLAALRLELLQHMDVASDHMAKAILDQLSKERLLELNQIYAALEVQHIANQEMIEILSRLNSSIAETTPNKVFPNSTFNTEKITEIIDAPDLSVSHKLKLSIPIIPFLLDYEADIGVNSKMDLQMMWDWLTKKLQIQ